MNKKIKSHGELSKREKQVLELLALGLNQVQVADKIFISQHTVNFHVRSILDKLTAANVTAAVAFALSFELIRIKIPIRQKHVFK